MYETLTCRENLGFAAAFIWPKLSTEARSELVQGRSSCHLLCLR